MKTPYVTSALAWLLTCAFSQSAGATLPSPPAGIEIPGVKSDRAVTGSIGRIDLLVGEAVLRDAEGTLWKASTGTPIRAGDVIKTGLDTRLRVVLNSGDALHLGDGTLIGIIDAGRLNLWSGQAAIYSKSVEGERAPLVLETPDGTLEAEGGKLGLSVSGSHSYALAFNNWDAWHDSDRFESGDARRDWRVLARWKDANGKNFSLASGLRHTGGAETSEAIASGEEVKFTYATSPEIPALKGALIATQQGDVAAKPLFSTLQKAFPGNAQAAYHLGRIALEAQDNLEALRQWQLYSKLDPEGAEKLGIGPRMTLLIHQTLKDEIKQAIASESTISRAPPEPGSVAVLPFINRGDAAQALLSKGLTAMVISDLSKVPGLKVLERAKLQKLIEEMQLSESGLVDEKTALRAGRLMKAEKIMLGDYQLQSDKK